MPHLSPALGWITTRQAVVVSDCNEFLESAKGNGFNTCELLTLTGLPMNSLVFSFSHDASRHTFSIAETSTRRRAIFCALHVFNPKVDIANYGLNLIMKSNFQLALSNQETLLKKLNGARRFLVEGEGCGGILDLIDDATPFALIGKDLESDYIHSVAEFFEVHYAHMQQQEPCPFSFSGTLFISGILMVLRKPEFDQTGEIRQALEELSDLIATSRATLMIENNTIVALKCNDVDYVRLLSNAAGYRGLALTEFAIGVNDALETEIDYRLNSQLNEGIAGIHVALGDGSSGYHIDFLSPRTRISPITLD